MKHFAKIAALAIAIPVLASTGTALADAQSGNYSGNTCKQADYVLADKHASACALAVFNTHQKLDFRVGAYDASWDGKSVKAVLTIWQRTTANSSMSLTGSWDAVNHGGKGTTQVGSNRTVTRGAGMNYLSSRLCLALVDGKKITDLGCNSITTTHW